MPGLSFFLTKPVNPDTVSAGHLTRTEIFQQPELWPETLERVTRFRERDDPLPPGRSSIVTGAGSSAYAAFAIATALPHAKAVPTTDLLTDAHPPLQPGGLLVSIARSGDSPESVGVVHRIQRLFPEIRHLAITCNSEGRLARLPGVMALLLDPRTNDRSLAMTSSFSNLALAGLCLARWREITAALPKICARVKENLAHLDARARSIASSGVDRMVVLGPAPMMGWAQEAALKILEMSAGRVPVMAETHLGLRHGPMSFLRPDTLVLSVVSSDPHRRRYEEDLLEELRAKGLGRIICVAGGGPPPDACETAPAMAPELPDDLRTPFEIVFPQLLAYHLSLGAGLNPDNPSPGGVITRVVQGVRIYES